MQRPAGGLSVQRLLAGRVGGMYAMYHAQDWKHNSYASTMAELHAF